MRLLLLLFAVCGMLNLNAQTTSTFEDLGLLPDTFAQKSTFNSGRAQFNNVYSGGFFSGFAISSKRDSVTAGSGNQYSAVTAGGVSNSTTYGISNTYGDAVIRLFGGAEGHAVKGCYITNTTFAYRSMQQGDAFAKKFGGASGNDPDWFRLTVKAWLHDTLKSQQVDFYLADFRDANNANDYIVKDWRWVNLQSLGDVDSLFFELLSSDTAGGFGMNTPAYFAIDNFTTTDGVVPGVVALNDTIITPYNQPRMVTVLKNDTFTNAASVTVTIIGGPQLFGATASVDSNRIFYQPAQGLIGNDTVWYQLCESGSCDTALLLADVRGLTANGIEESESVAIQFGPNPFENSIIVSAALPIEEVRIADMQGKIVAYTNPESRLVQFNVSTLPSGTYIIDIRTAVATSRQIAIRR